MRLGSEAEWDEAGGVLQMMIGTLRSTRPTPENQLHIAAAIEHLTDAQKHLLKAGVYSKEFQPDIYFY